MAAEILENTRMNSSSSYFVPANSKWPIITAIAALLTVGSLILLFNELPGGVWMFLAGLGLLTYCMVGWWAQVARESEGGDYKQWEDASFRWGMGWFIFSEVMFFAGFFGALFYARTLSVPDLGGAHSKILWPAFDAIWPTAGPHLQDKVAGEFGTIPAFGVPLANTIVLLASGATITWAHWGLLLNRRRQLTAGLALTIVLGIIFLFLQAEEYVHAYRDLNLRLDSGIYGSTFFMLTGFHGLHVTIGTISLIAIFARSLAGHFSPSHHFGFEAVAWYWHFVDVVWLFLFVVVYWL